MRTTRTRSAQSWAASRRQQRLHGGGRKLMLRYLSTRSAAAHAHSTQPADALQRDEVLPTLPPAAELVKPHLRANLPNAGIVRGGEHGIFVRGCESISSMKGCSLGMIIRCVRTTRASCCAVAVRTPMPFQALLSNGPSCLDRRSPSCSDRRHRARLACSPCASSKRRDRCCSCALCRGSPWPARGTALARTTSVVMPQ